MIRSRQPSRYFYSGFTLVELLVVIAIIGVLVALLLPAVQAAREAARRTQCQSNLKQITLAILNYASTNKGRLPPGGITNGPCCNTKSNENWAISILPYLEQQGLYDIYRFDKYNEDIENHPVLQTILPVYLCPSDQDTQVLEKPETGPGAYVPMARGSYRANVGRCGDPPEGYWDSPSETTSFSVYNADNWKGPFHATGKSPANSSIRYQEHIPKLKQITDGLSNTIFNGEATSAETKSGVRGIDISTLRRRTFWGYTYTSYNKSCIVPQSRTLLSDFGRCVEVGGPGGVNPCKRAWGSLHPGGLHFTYGDGSVRFIETAIDMVILAEMSTMSGGELVKN